jgi:hypothetical protein
MCLYIFKVCLSLIAYSPFFFLSPFEVCYIILCNENRGKRNVNNELEIFRTCILIYLIYVCLANIHVILPKHDDALRRYVIGYIIFVSHFANIYYYYYNFGCQFIYLFIFFLK